MAETFILGNDYTITTDSMITQLNNNILVVGPSGSGKTMSYAEMCLLKTNNSSLIVTLSKRKLVNKYLSYYRNKGYRVYDLNLAEPYTSNVSYDPLYYVKNTADITYIARSIVVANPKKNESNFIRMLLSSYLNMLNRGKMVYWKFRFIYFAMILQLVHRFLILRNLFQSSAKNKSLFQSYYNQSHN